MGLNRSAFASELRRPRLWSNESRADHGLENFGDSLYPYERYGRHVGTRTPDLYRVKGHITATLNNLHDDRGRRKYAETRVSRSFNGTENGTDFSAVPKPFTLDRQEEPSQKASLQLRVLGLASFRIWMSGSAALPEWEPTQWLPIGATT